MSGEFVRLARPTGDTRPTKVADLIAGHLRGEIVRGRLAEGDVLPPEAHLMETFGVSRSTLREAIRVLESERLVRVRRGAQGGTQVLAPDDAVASRYIGLLLQARHTTIEDVLGARTVLEPPTVGMVASRATRADIARLYALCEVPPTPDGDASDDPTSTLHRGFHQELVALSGSRTVTVIANMIETIIDEASRRFVTVAVRDPASVREHEIAASKAHLKVVSIIEARDAAGAEKFWRAHLRQTAKIMLAGLDSETVVDLLSPDVSQMWGTRRDRR